MSYTAQDIETLSFRDAVRERVAMYMGSADNQGVLQCVREIITNSIDEMTMGYGDTITVQLLKDNYVTVADNARGVPLVFAKTALKQWKLYIQCRIRAASLMKKFIKMLLV